MPQAPLPHADVKRLKLVIEIGHELEKIWATLPSPSDVEASRKRDHLLAQLIESVRALEQATDENVRRLSFHTRNLSVEMTSRHLATILVPFERLLGKAMRDDELLIEEGDKTIGPRVAAPLRVIADNLRSAFNVGAILRTSECFGVEHVTLTGYTPTPDQDKTAKTSLGTENAIPWSSRENVHDEIDSLRAQGYVIIALETAQSAVLLEDFVWPEKCALLLGNERFGLDRDVLDQAEHIVKIPMYGVKNSLNVGIACGIALQDWRAKFESRVPSAPHAFEPVATFHSDAVHRYEAPRQASLDQRDARVELRKDLPLEIMRSLEGFDRIWLIYRFHHNTNWKPLVRPPRGSREKRGVFATRSPYRPNPIGLSAVELVKIEGRTLHVRGTDLLDETPILDIKPYVAYADSHPNAKLGWLEGVEETKCEVTFAEKADAQLAWLETAGVTNLREFLITQLQFEPTDDQRKRVIGAGDGYQLAYRTWRASFALNDGQVVVREITSGYSAQDLSVPEDRYGDKEIHRAFQSRA